MTIRGHAENGVIVLDEDVRLPDGTKVSIEVSPAPHDKPLHPVIQRLSGVIPPNVDVEAVMHEIDRISST